MSRSIFHVNKLVFDVLVKNEKKYTNIIGTGDQRVHG